MYAISTMTKNQGNRLKEWVIYHYNLGFEKFIIFLDSCSDDSYEILKSIKNIDIDIYETKDIEDGLYMDLWWVERSHKMYDYVLKKYNFIDWIAFIEVDEFIFPQEKNFNLSLFLNSQKAGCIYINSWDFKPPFDENNLILGQSKMIWTDKQRNDSEYTWRGKSIIRPDQFSFCIDAHHFYHKIYGVSSEFKKGRSSYLQYYDGEQVFINDSILKIYHFRNHTPNNLDEYCYVEYL